MNTSQIRELVDQLESMSKRYSVGYKNDEAIRAMTPVLRALDSECGSNAYLGEKVVSARHNFDTMFSPRKHLKYGGADEVAYRFRSDLGSIVKWLDNFTRENNITTEREP